MNIIMEWLAYLLAGGLLWVFFGKGLMKGLRGVGQRRYKPESVKQKRLKSADVSQPHPAKQPDGITMVCFIDTETTGLNRDGTDEVVEIAIVDADGATLLNSLVRPVRNTSWPNAQTIHGISPQDVINAPTWAALLPTIAEICANRTVVFYNAPFDMSFFPSGFFPAVACAMRRYSEVSNERSGWVQLSVAASASGYPSTGVTHRALEDALACRHIWLFGIPSHLNAYPKKSSPQVIDELALATAERIPVAVEEVIPEDLRFVTANDPSVTYSPIDDDVFKCFIAYRTGMCAEVGTWEDFRKIEDEMVRICRDRGGRYYRSKAKGAKFAFIFYSYAQTTKNVCRLQNEGYKVTTFERAIAHFGLEKIWDHGAPQRVGYPLPIIQGWPVKAYLPSSAKDVLHYQDVLAELAGNHGDGKCRLFCEGIARPDGNGEFDIVINGKVVGMLADNAAKTVIERQTEMGRTGQQVRFSGVIVGGFIQVDGTRAYYGVRLELNPEDLWPMSIKI